ncbi:hypothetical protein Agub_g1050, partial [Astrephomene gubernaculifera]
MLVHPNPRRRFIHEYQRTYAQLGVTGSLATHLHKYLNEDVELPPPARNALQANPRARHLIQRTQQDPTNDSSASGALPCPAAANRPRGDAASSLLARPASTPAPAAAATAADAPTAANGNGDKRNSSRSSTSTDSEEGCHTDSAFDETDVSNSIYCSDPDWSDTPDLPADWGGEDNDLPSAGSSRGGGG